MSSEMKESIYKVCFSVLLYIIYALVGIISCLTIGLILPSIILMWVQGFILLLTHTFGIYLSFKVLQDEQNSE